MKVQSNGNKSNLLSNIKVGDYLIAINSISVSSFPESFTEKQWGRELSQIDGYKLLCFFRKNDQSHVAYIPSKVLSPFSC